MKALGDYVHAAGLSFAMYTAESTETCGGYPASLGFEALDAKTFAEWGVDCALCRGEGIRLCNAAELNLPPPPPQTSRSTVAATTQRASPGRCPSALMCLAALHSRPFTCSYPKGYKDMGAALEASGREIVYSCSWPAYIGSDESVKPFGTFIMDGCNLWRNWDDIQCDWGSLGSIIDHWCVSVSRVRWRTHASRPSCTRRVPHAPAAAAWGP